MSYENILATEVLQFLQEKQAIVFDMRDTLSFNQGHIEGAQQVSDESIGLLIRRKEHERPVLVYCYHGVSSRDFASFLAQFGFRNIYNLEGGWQAWQAHMQNCLTDPQYPSGSQ